MPTQVVEVQRGEHVAGAYRVSFLERAQPTIDGDLADARDAARHAEGEVEGLSARLEHSRVTS